VGGDKPTRVERAADVRHFDAEVDVLVVGLGCAGASAAIEVHDAGADVLVLERTGGGGGASANSGGLIYMGGGTPVQKAAGFDDTPEEMYKFLVAVSEPGACEEKIAPFCEQSVEHFHWLEAQGVPFKRSFYPEPSMESRTDDCLVYSGGEDASPFRALARPAPRGHKPQTKGKAGPFFMQCLLGAVTRRGIALETDVRVTNLLAEGDGRIVGVLARQAGERRAYRARRGVVLAAGGFSMNAEMVAEHAPELAKCNSLNALEADDGTGIRLGLGAGGSTLRMDQVEVALPATIPQRLSRGVYVNCRGQRFINEDTYLGHIGIEALLRQQGQVYLVHDEATYELGLVRAKPSHVAETLEELEEEAGFPRGALVSTLALYNEHAERGEDPLFGKRAELLKPLREPPFALIDCSTEEMYYAGMTLGGLRTRATGEVVTADDDVVPGLYAAGRTAALFCGRGYAASGISLADGTFFGRWAGRSAAAAE
jgi:3-oxo-5alpha-steroid 4-dehydrogenase